MANCEKQIGSYGLVTRINGPIDCSRCPKEPMIRQVDPTAPWWRELPEALLRSFSRKGIEDPQLTVIHHILDHGQVSESDINRLTVLTARDLGIFFGNLITAGTKRVSTGYRLWSDFCEVLPRDLPAKFFLGAVDSYNMQLYGRVDDLPGFNTLDHAINMFVLLPSDARRGIFERMIQPPDTDNARGFLRLVALTVGDAGVGCMELLQLVKA
ncbi:MAG: hypothetical protein PHV63_01355 [Candidatus Daviesbacteria bacterium]|nr:hypothetical protein [Candidatus Daviesbacteria bacterium]